MTKIEHTLKRKLFILVFVEKPLSLKRDPPGIFETRQAALRLGILG